MVSLTLNGETRQLPDGVTVRTAVGDITGREVGADGRAADGGSLGIAVAVDGAVVPRSQWAQTPLTEGQSVEIVTAVQGG